MRDFLFSHSSYSRYPPLPRPLPSALCPLASALWLLAETNFKCLVPGCGCALDDSEVVFLISNIDRFDVDR